MRTWAASDEFTTPVPAFTLPAASAAVRGWLRAVMPASRRRTRPEGSAVRDTPAVQPVVRIEVERRVPIMWL